MELRKEQYKPINEYFPKQKINKPEVLKAVLYVRKNTKRIEQQISYGYRI